MANFCFRNADEMRAFIEGPAPKKCPRCNATGIEYWYEDNITGDQFPVFPEGEDPYRFERCDGTCDNCEGVGYIVTGHCCV